MSKISVVFSVACGLILSTACIHSAFADAPADSSEPRARLGSDASAIGSDKSDSEKSKSSSRVARLETAQNEDMAVAVGHYARSRSLLIAALNEFDSGMKLANPDSLLDSKRFRAGIIDRAEELERILDPQPRATKGGVKYSADPRLLGSKK